MRFLWRWFKRAVVGVLVLAVLLLLPVVYVEFGCRGTDAGTPYAPIITESEWQRAESRTLTTYPEWHIVHAYDDYAKVLASGDPHDFDYIRAVAGFWTSLCPLAKASSEMGGFTQESKMTIYTIGVSFSAELLFKALYEETLGRIATIVRGAEPSSLDVVSAQSAAAYAAFLQQTPWYKWPFQEDVEALSVFDTGSFRDRERRIALGFEFRAKSAYAGVIENAVAGVGADELRIRSVVEGLASDGLAEIDGVTVIEERADGTLIETDRYRAFTRILQELAGAGVEFVEIAGNDEILFTMTDDLPTAAGALYSFPRQGYGDWRHLLVVPVRDLASWIRTVGDQLEHVHDY